MSPISTGKQIGISAAYILSATLAVLFPAESITGVFSIAGFRLYLPFFVPFIIALVLLYNNKLKPVYFTGSDLKTAFIPAVVFILALGILYSQNYLSLNLKANLFYEAGATAVTDLPVYLIWNAPLLFLFFLPLSFLPGKLLQFTGLLMFGVIITAIVSSEEGITVDVTRLLHYLPIILSVALAGAAYSSVTAKVIATYLLLYFPVVALGTDDPRIRTAFLGTNINEWSGFFVTPPKSDFPAETILLFAQCAVTLFLFVLSLRSSKKAADRKDGN